MFGGAIDTTLPSIAVRAAIISEALSPHQNRATAFFRELINATKVGIGKTATPLVGIIKRCFSGSAIPLRPNSCRLKFYLRLEMKHYKRYSAGFKEQALVKFYSRGCQ